MYVIWQRREVCNKNYIACSSKVIYYFGISSLPFKAQIFDRIHNRNRVCKRGWETREECAVNGNVALKCFKWNVNLFLCCFSLNISTNTHRGMRTHNLISFECIIKISHVFFSTRSRAAATFLRSILTYKNEIHKNIFGL